jgi:hypothetical protein
MQLTALLCSKTLRHFCYCQLNKIKHLRSPILVFIYEVVFKQYEGRYV